MRYLLLMLALICTHSAQGDQFGVSKGDLFCVVDKSLYIGNKYEKCGLTDARPPVTGWQSMIPLKKHPLFNRQHILLSPTMGACAVQLSQIVEHLDGQKHSMTWRIRKRISSSLFSTEENFEHDSFSKNEFNGIIAGVVRSLQRVYGPGQSYNGFFKMTPSNFNFENSGLPLGKKASSSVNVMVWKSPLPDDLEKISLWLKVTNPIYFTHNEREDVTLHNYSYDIKIVLDYSYNNYSKCQTELEAAKNDNSVF